jgi:hypothetical protein
MTIGSYIFLGEGGAGPDNETVWQVPMVVSPSMPQGQFLVGAFAQSTILFSREVLILEIAFQNEDDFVKNLVCLRGELRSAAAVPAPAGVLKGTMPHGQSHPGRAASGEKNARRPCGTSRPEIRKFLMSTPHVRERSRRELTSPPAQGTSSAMSRPASRGRRWRPGHDRPYERQGAERPI